MSTTTTDIIRQTRPHFADVPDPLYYIDGETITRTDYLIYASLSHHADRTERCWPGVKYLAKRWHFNKHSIYRSLAKLQYMELIRIEKQITDTGIRNIYTLLNASFPSPEDLRRKAQEFAKQEASGAHSQKHKQSEGVVPLGAQGGGGGSASRSTTGSASRSTLTTCNRTSQKTTTTPPEATTLPGPGSPPALEPILAAPAAVVVPPVAPQKALPASPELYASLAPLVGSVLAQQWVTVYGADRVREVYTWSQHEATKNVGGYLRKALEEAWPEPASITQSRQRALQQQAAADKLHADDAEAQRIAAARNRDLDTKQTWWASLDDDTRHRWWNTPVSELAPGMPFLVESFKKNRGSLNAPSYGWLSAVHHYVQGGLATSRHAMHGSE